MVKNLPMMWKQRRCSCSNHRQMKHTRETSELFAGIFGKATRAVLQKGISELSRQRLVPAAERMQLKR
jgi:hypothetical protein